jgi:hypothetical protein
MISRYVLKNQETPGMCLSAMSHKACPLDAMIIVLHLARGEHDCPKLLVDVLCGHAFLPAMKTRLLFAGDDLNVFGATMRWRTGNKIESSCAAWCDELSLSSFQMEFAFG